MRPITDLEREGSVSPELVAAVARIRAAGATALDVQYSTDMMPDERVWVAVATWSDGSRDLAAGFTHDDAVDRLVEQHEAAVARQQARPKRIFLGPVPQDVPAGSRCQFTRDDLVWTAAEDLRAGEIVSGDPATLRMYVDRR